LQIANFVHQVHIQGLPPGVYPAVGKPESLGFLHFPAIGHGGYELIESVIHDALHKSFVLFGERAVPCAGVFEFSALDHHGFYTNPVHQLLGV